MTSRNSFVDFATWTTAGAIALLLAYAFATRSSTDNSSPAPSDTNSPFDEHIYSQCVVSKVLDGDSLLVDHNGEILEVRIAGIDCPEFEQDFGESARDAAVELCRNKNVRLKRIDTDRYGRMVADVTTESKDIAAELLRRGLAWHYTKYDNSPLFAELETKARAARLGIWAQPNPIPPWEFRDTKRQLENR